MIRPDRQNYAARQCRLHASLQGGRDCLIPSAFDVDTRHSTKTIVGQL